MAARRGDGLYEAKNTWQLARCHEFARRDAELAIDHRHFFALFFWGAKFNVSAAVGYIAVFAVSVLNGVVLVSSIRQANGDGLPIEDAIVRGCEIRFRPMFVSAVVAVVGFSPTALSHGIGAEIQRPLARVVIGGLVSSTPLTLLVLPAVYARLSRRRRHAATVRPRESDSSEH